MTSSLPFVAAIMVKTSDMMEGERLQRFVFQQVERGGEGEILGILRWVKPNNDQDHCIAQKSVDSFSFGRRRSLLGVSATSKRRERGSSKPRRRLSR